MRVTCLSMTQKRQVWELNDPELDIDIDSKDSSRVEIEVWLMDDIGIIPDPEGLIVFRGQRYRVDEIPIDVAESGEFIGQSA